MIVLVALMPPDAAVMTAVPTVTPVTRPLLFTVATPVVLDDQVSAAAMALPFWSFGNPVN